MKVTKIGKHTYLEGLYSIRDIEKTNWAFFVDCPNVFTAYGKATQSENWQRVTSINTPNSIIDFLNEDDEDMTTLYSLKLKGLTDSEKYELVGLFYAIASINEAYGVFHGGNHGTSEGLDISNKKLANDIVEATKPIIERANELILKIK